MALKGKNLHLLSYIVDTPLVRVLIQNLRKWTELESIVSESLTLLLALIKVRENEVTDCLLKQNGINILMDALKTVSTIFMM
jgi:hypothetical protein